MYTTQNPRQQLPYRQTNRDVACRIDLTPTEARAEGRAEAQMEQEVRMVRDGLSSLNGPERIVLTLYYFEGLTLEQIGSVLNVTPSCATRVRARGLASLRGSLAQRAA